jgi:hypothetical protein
MQPYGNTIDLFPTAVTDFNNLEKTRANSKAMIMAYIGRPQAQYKMKLVFKWMRNPTTPAEGGCG